MTQKNVVYLKGIDFLWMDVVESLERSEGWKPVLWDTPFLPALAEARARFPETLFYDQGNARKGIPPEGFSISDLSAVDADILKVLSLHEHAIYEMMSRWFLLGKDTLDWDYRRHFYYNFIRIWITVIRDLNIDLILSGSIPHRTYDYVLYLLCRHMGIPYLMIDGTNLDHMLYSISSITDRSRAIREELEKSGDSLSLSPPTIEYIDRIRKSYDEAMPSYFKEKVVAAQNTSILRKFYDQLPEALQTPLKIIKHAVKGNLPDKVGMLQFSNDPSFDNSIPEYTNALQLFLAQGKVNRTVNNAKHWYIKHSVKPDLSKPFIYFAANYQPERSTCPDAGIYQDLHLLVNILSTAVPEGWTIYYKEHPTTFRQPYRIDNVRSVRFYERIKRLPNCKFVDYKTDPFELIDNSMATAIATSTSGFEAMLRGVPVIEFGDSWYSSCSGVLRVRSFNECKEAIERIREGYKPDQDKVMKYIAATEAICVDVQFRREHKTLIQMKQEDPPQYADKINMLAKMFSDEYCRLHNRETNDAEKSRLILK